MIYIVIYDKLKTKIRGGINRSKHDNSAEYNRLFEQYNKKSNEELSEIVNPESGYTEIAQKVASDILNSDRTEYYKNMKIKQSQTTESDKDETLLDIRNDIHAIKNMLMFFVILTVLGLVFGFYTVFVTIPKLF